MADDDPTTSIDELLGLDRGDDERVDAPAPVAPVEALSIDDFLAAYEELATDDTGDDDDADNDDAGDDDAGDDDAAAADDDRDEVTVEPDEDDTADDVRGDDLLELAEQTAEQLRTTAAERAAEEAASAALAAATERAQILNVDEPRRSDPPEPMMSGALGAATSTGLLLQYPSRDFPPPPVVRLEVPMGWLGTAVADCEMAARGPERIDGIYPTIVMRVRRIAASSATDASLAQSMGLPDDDDIEVIADEMRADATAPARRILVRRVGPDGVVTRTRHLLVHVPATEHVASVVAIAATWPESADAELGQRLTEVLSSVRIFMPQRGR